jgi:hypothetical protein
MLMKLACSHAAVCAIGILVNPFNMAIADLAIASHAYQVAQQQGLGLWLER